MSIKTFITTGSHFVQPQDLLTFIRRLTPIEKREIASRSFLHPNQFYKVMLKTAPNGQTSRLHLWRKLPNNQYYHNHGWDFTSHILYGSLLDFHYQERPVEDKTKFQENEDSGILVSKYGDQITGDGSYNFSRLYDCQLVEVGQYLREAGTSYHLESHLIHQTHPQVDGTITLIHQEPLKGTNDIYVPRGSGTDEFLGDQSYGKLTVKELEEIFLKVITILDSDQKSKYLLGGSKYLILFNTPTPKIRWNEDFTVKQEHHQWTYRNIKQYKNTTYWYTELKANFVNFKHDGGIEVYLEYGGITSIHHSDIVSVGTEDEIKTFSTLSCKSYSEY